MAAQDSNTNKNVVVMAMDGSDTASRAFEWYRQHLHRQGNYIVFVHCPELHLNVHVLPPYSDLTQLEKEVQLASKRADEMVFDLTQMLHSYKVKVVLRLDLVLGAQRITKLLNEQLINVK
ncbi:hypothetical protein C0Q70_15337 [Pomacea canaliculata]|uniref:UspA domain-containing protein n=1 Tax=Pomacea canaliculata TaxID=400727 RepID=A0A2T7NUL1_POMCA|nr:hypothetical protein C0Q70_15337 [Pomacea canaliculata]